MRTLGRFLLMVGMAAAVLFLVGYARNVWWLYEVRPWRGLHNFTEASVTVYRPRPDGNATAKTMRVEPFFPPAFDLEPDCKMIARFPSWFVALPVLIVLVGGARTIYYELDGEAV